MNKRKEQTKKLVLGAILTALVILLQFLGSFIKLGPFSISLVLVPIVMGAALCGYKIGAWLGFVFGAVVLFSGDAAAFLAIDVLGTILTVLIKGILCGLIAGLAYNIISAKNQYLAVTVSAIICPIVNTGVFLAGCRLFFMSAITEWAVGEGFQNATKYMFLVLAGGNFLVELAVNIILAPIILRIISITSKKH